MATFRVLLTAFEPFGGEAVNPSAVALQQLAAQGAPSGVTLQTLLLPVTFKSSARLLTEHLSVFKPDLVLCIGQAGGRAQLSLEQVGINLLEARIPDNDGWQPSGLPVVTDAPAAYFSNLPLKALCADLNKAGIPAQISYSAGTYVCNATLYQLMHQITVQQLHCRGGFIHIPYAPAQVCDKPGQPSMAIETVVSALWQCIQSCQRHQHDISATAGALD